jgi:uncharacterized membrane protein YeiB
MTGAPLSVSRRLRFLDIATGFALIGAAVE